MHTSDSVLGACASRRRQCHGQRCDGLLEDRKLLHLFGRLIMHSQARQSLGSPPLQASAASSCSIMQAFRIPAIEPEHSKRTQSGAPDLA